MKFRLSLFTGNIALFFVLGMVVVTTNSILVYVMNEYGLGYNLTGLLIAVQAAGNLTGNFFCGWLSRIFGRRRLLYLSQGLFITGFGGMLFVFNPVQLYIMLFLIGLGWGIVNCSVNLMVSEATDGSGSKLSLVHTAYTVGAFISPLIVALSSISGMTWRLSVGIIALMSMLLTFVIKHMPVSPHISKSKNQSGECPGLLTNWHFYLMLLILFAYGGVEAGISSWMVTYLSETGILGIEQAQTMLSLMWVMMLTGRLFSIVVSRHMNKALMLMFMCMGLLLGAFLLIFSGSILGIFAAVVIIGLSMSAMYAIIVANSSSYVNNSGVAAGMLFALGGVGAAVFPYSVGVFAAHKGIFYGMVLLTVSIFCFAILSVVNVIANKNKYRREKD